MTAPSNFEDIGSQNIMNKTFIPDLSTTLLQHIHKSKMYVIKRDGSAQDVHFDKISTRIQNLCNIDPKVLNVEPAFIAKKVIQGIYPGVLTEELDVLTAETCASLISEHPNYGDLAARVSISNLHKQTSSKFSEVMNEEYNATNPVTNEKHSLISKDLYEVVNANRDLIDSKIDHNRDYLIQYFGFMTLLKSYLVKVNGKVVERPQHLFMRVALGIHGKDINAAFESYDMMSTLTAIHATPTLYNAGTPNPQCSSCFIIDIQSDSIIGIYDTLKDCALISKSAGGIGISMHKIRASESYIKGTNGYSNGLVPMLRVFNDTARYVDQGGGKRNGAFAVYLEPWHADIIDFLNLKKNHGKEERRARDLFYGLWIPDLFMKRVEEDGDWSLFCPNEAKGLHDVWGDEFETLYKKYESTPNLARKVIKAQDLWFTIIDSQIETGNPYMLYKDAANRKSNQKNLGTIKSSNLCTEIMEYTSPEETAVCNLASIALPKMIEDGKFNHDKLYEVTKILVRNLNKIIDLNHYPIKSAEVSNLRHRPLGIGIQGLADAFILLKLPFDSEEAAQLNRDISETIYFGAVTESIELAKTQGHYETYIGSPLSEGILQYDMWGVKPSDRWDWDKLKENLKIYGARNSLLIAPMPTASTSQILGNNECFEPYTSNLYNRRVKSGEFIVINRHLVKDLIELNLWNFEIRNMIIAHQGSIAKINQIPQNIKDLYKTAWEISPRVLINQAADRGPFIDQSQSCNVFIADPESSKLSSVHFYSWKKGLKTGLYYLRRKAAVDSIQFTVDKSAIEKYQDMTKTQCIPITTDIEDLESDSEEMSCSMREGCISCSG